MKKQLDRFVLTDLLSQGTSGSFYAADERLPGEVKRSVRLKVLPALHRSDPTGEARFVDELRILADLSACPYVAALYGAGITDGVPWIAMEAVSSTVEALLSQSPADVGAVARIIEQVARGLSALHGLQPPRLHNRLQMANILMCDAGRHFKLMEFGLAAPPTAEPTLSADSVRYAAPELINADAGKPGPWTDLYALGHIAYELALGGKLHRQQFPAVVDGAADLRAVNPSRWQAWHHSMQTVVAPAHDVVRGFPAPLGEVIAKMMAKPIAARYASADDVVAAVGGAGAQVAVSEAPGPTSPTISVLPERRPGTPPPPPVGISHGGGATATPHTPAPATSGGGGQRYFVKLRQQTSGPYDLATLQRLSRQGQISRLHQVSTDQRTWKSASSIEGLF